MAGCPALCRPVWRLGETGLACSHFAQGVREQAHRPAVHCPLRPPMACWDSGLDLFVSNRAESSGGRPLQSEITSWWTVAKALCACRPSLCIQLVRLARSDTREVLPGDLVDPGQRSAECVSPFLRHLPGQRCAALPKPPVAIAAPARFAALLFVLPLLSQAWWTVGLWPCCSCWNSCSSQWRPPRQSQPPRSVWPERSGRTLNIYSEMGRAPHF